MSIKNPHLLEKEIHGTFNWDVNTADSFKNEIISLLSSYPISESQNFHMFVHVVQEFNRKADKFGLFSSIIGPIDAGFRPLSLDDLLGDFLLLENGSHVLQENSSKLELEQDDIISYSTEVVAFTISYYPESIVVTAGSVTPEQIGDANYETSNPPLYYNGGRLIVNNSITVDEFVDLNPEIATTDSNGFITRVSEGLASFSFTDSGLTKVVEVDLTNKSDGATVTEFTSVVGGSLAEHLSLQIDDKIDNTMTMATNGKLFSTQDHSTPSYIRNVNFWNNSNVDLTCISPWNSNSSNRKAGTAITKRHIVNAAHYEYGIGTVVRFVTSDNVVVERTVTGKKRHPDYNPYSPDLTVYTLDSDLPASITPCKLFPADNGDYITLDNLNDTRPAAMGLDQEEKGLIIDLASNRSFRTSSDVDRLIFNESKISGDSGNPAFVMVNGELVLITIWTFGGAGSGTAISDNIDDLNQMIIDADAQAGVSTGYTVTEADISAFPTYP